MAFKVLSIDNVICVVSVNSFEYQCTRFLAIGMLPQIGGIRSKEGGIEETLRVSQLTPRATCMLFISIRRDILGSFTSSMNLTSETGGRGLSTMCLFLDWSKISVAAY